MKVEAILAIILAIYLGMGLFTFGRAWNEPNCINTLQEKCRDIDRLFIGGFAATFWPLYWSIETQKGRQ